MKKHNFQDSVNIGQVKTTSDGYVTTYARAVRSGVQKYRASEIGLIGSHIVGVYRPESEVRDVASMASFSHAPITIDHPKELVTTDNWKDLSVGEVSTEAHWDGSFISIPLVLKDAGAIALVKSGKRELSAGYTADIDFEDGIAPDGTPYEAVQRNIRINHLAIVDKARAGSQARIGDAQTWGAAPITVEDAEMTIEVKTVVLGDKAVSVVAKDADTVAAILSDHAAVVADKDKSIGELTAKLAAAEAKVLSDEDLVKLVDAKVLANEKRAKVAAHIGDEAASKLNDEAIEGALAVIGDKEPVNDTAREAIKSKGHKPINDADERISAAQRKFLNLEVK